MAGDSQLGAGTHDLVLELGDRERSYYLHLPPSVRSGAPLPLVLAFHRDGGRASGYRNYTRLDALSDREGFAVAYPDGTGPERLGRRLETWNAGGCCGLAVREGVDDVAFARALVDEIAQRVRIDRSRVYATGHSNGAMMAYRLAAEAPDLLAAIAPVAGAMLLEPFEATEPMPVLHIHSVDDSRAPYVGGRGALFPLADRIGHNAVEEELDRWVRLNGCPRKSILVAERRERATGHSARQLRFAPCTSGAEVELWRLTGPDHRWPGADTARHRRVPNTQVIDASEEIWRFLSRFQKKAKAAEAQTPQGQE
jgi:polyhydroxybutyrate depolymerase